MTLQSRGLYDSSIINIVHNNVVANRPSPPTHANTHPISHCAARAYAHTHPHTHTHTFAHASLGPHFDAEDTLVYKQTKIWMRKRPHLHAHHEQPMPHHALRFKFYSLHQSKGITHFSNFCPFYRVPQPLILLHLAPGDCISWCVPKAMETRENAS